MAPTRKLLQFKESWWNSKPGDIHADLFSLMRTLDEKQSYHKTNNLMNFRLYGNANVMGIGSNYTSQDKGPENRVSINLCQSVSDTVHSKLGSQTPTTTFLTKGGDFQIQKKAKKLEQFVDGIKYHTDYDAKRLQVFLDACVFGTGCLKIYECNGKIKCERVLIDNIKVDDLDGMYGTPRNIYDERFVSRETLAENYPKYASDIMRVEGPTWSSNVLPLAANFQKLYNQIRVTEAFRLPNESNGKGGRHVICIDNKDLIDEDWETDSFPFVFFRWSPRLVGFMGQGIVEQVRSIQLEMNKLIRTYQTSIHLGAIPYVVAEINSKFSSGLWNNEPMRIVKYQNVKPEIVAPQSVPPDLFNAINWLYQKAYEIVGVSTMDAQAKKPEGLDSGKAIREFHDIGSERFMTVGKRWEKFDQECSKLFIAAAKYIDENEEEGFEVCCTNRKFIETIQWSDIKLDEEDYILQTFPTSSLPKEPAGRLQTIQELLQAGLIPPEVGTKLLDFPDLDAYQSQQNGPYDSFQFQIDEILENSNYIGPEPFQKQYLPMGIQLMGGAYLKATSNSVPEDRLDLMRNWLNAAMDMMQPPPMPSPPQGQLPPGPSDMPPGGPTPQANPMPPPQSNLIPNAPGTLQ